MAIKFEDKPQPKGGAKKPAVAAEKPAVSRPPPDGELALEQAQETASKAKGRRKAR